MIHTNVILLHGFASSSKSEKARYLSQQFNALPEVGFHPFDFNPAPADFENMTITGMINRLRQHISEHDYPDVRLIGSSLGGLTALHYTNLFGEVARLLLLAPALHFLGADRPESERQQWEMDDVMPVSHYYFQQTLGLKYGYYTDGLQYTATVPPPVPVTIIHGIHDAVVPIEGSRAYAAAYPERVQLVEVDSDHRLTGQLELIWQYTQSFLLT